MSDRAARTTVAPSAARRLAVAAPMPREAPVTSTTLPSSDSFTSATLVFHVVARCFPEPDPDQLARRNPRRQLLPDVHRNVLRRGEPVGKPGHVDIQVMMVEGLVHVFVEQRLEDRHVEHV